jgi:hypothetical protein
MVVVVVAACTHHFDPVPGAAAARARHYAVTVTDARTALEHVLRDRYGRLDGETDRRVYALAACRDSDGDPCVTYAPSGRYDPDTRSAIGHAPILRSGAVTGRYVIQLYGDVVGQDGDVQVVIGARARDVTKHTDPARPPFLPHEVDEAQVAIDRALATR